MSKPDKNTRYHFEAKEAKLKTGITDGNGWLEGYAINFGNVDLGKEIIAKGATKKSIKEVVPAGKVKLMAVHYAYGGGAKDVIGTITEAKEDDRGLWYHAEFAGTEDAQNIRQKINEGHLGHCSIGYMPITWEWDEDEEVLTHKEIRVCEVTVTPCPMNELAELTSSKSANEEIEILSQKSPEKIIELIGGKENAGRLKSDITALGHLLSKTLEPQTPAEKVDLHSQRSKTQKAKTRLMKILSEV